MKPLLEGLISGAQSAFVPGRLITDNIMLAYEVHHYLRRKTQGKEGIVALKVDMSKAYDRVEWGFLDAILLKMGFAARWVSILMETVSSVQYHILHEQSQLGPIIPGRGLRLMESENMRDLLDTYSKASGQRINYDKSMVTFSANVPPPMRKEVQRILEITEGDTTGRYFGLPSLVGKRKKDILGFLKDRILAKVRSWNAKFLSGAGREVLLKNVIQAMPSYAMMVFLLPKGLCKEIEVLMNEYWWSGTVGARKGLRWKF
ncbi:PREDICTED: uncharacterized protein LOC109162271 [Ipomoea nil]|uniref:uncharacterized protein LOC109162271 n=1 Tax=Ipomoea nil TaxID=35883 RepID=UPI000901D35C|nr:PREDICTED: uncharacterized protein LOC109162271 [Ipomoea nil]